MLSEFLLRKSFRLSRAENTLRECVLWCSCETGDDLKYGRVGGCIFVVHKRGSF